MIQANELRIGNWVVFDNDSFPEQMRLESFAVLYKYPERIVSINPIPLTPKILEKAGFIKDNFYHILTGRGDQTTFSISWDGAILNVFDNGFEMAHGVLLLAEQSKYVHQLQNLYFALTGEELEINLNP